MKWFVICNDKCTVCTYSHIRTLYVHTHIHILDKTDMYILYSSDSLCSYWMLGARCARGVNRALVALQLRRIPRLKLNICQHKNNFAIYNLFSWFIQPFSTTIFAFFYNFKNESKKIKEKRLNRRLIKPYPYAKHQVLLEADRRSKI